MKILYIYAVHESTNGGVPTAWRLILPKNMSLSFTLYWGRAQRHFLHELDVTPEQAFIDHNFAPPNLRRDIGILGLLHKRVLGISHPIFFELLPFHADVFGSLRTGEHNKQLYGHILEVQFQHALHFRSIFAMVYVYNRLPQEVVDCTSVSMFQRSLTLKARKLCRDGDPNWTCSVSCRVQIVHIRLRCVHVAVFLRRSVRG